MSNRCALNGAFYYLGCLDNADDRTSLLSLRTGFKDRTVWAVDINPHSFSLPYRVFVDAASDEEAIEVIEQHIQNEPTGLIAGCVLTWEIEASQANDDWGYGQWFKIGDRFLCAAEDAYVGVGRVNEREAVATTNGGCYERMVRRIDPAASLDTDDIPGYTVFGKLANGRHGRLANYVHPDGDRPTQALRAWKLAAEKVLKGKV